MNYRNKSRARRANKRSRQSARERLAELQGVVQDVLDAAAEYVVEEHRGLDSLPLASEEQAS